MFLHVSVILFTGGVQAQAQEGCLPGGRCAGPRGVCPGGCTGPGPWECAGPGPGGVLAQAWGVSRPRPGCRGCPGPGQGGPGPGEGDVCQHALKQTPPPQQTATAADGTHPTGMHSCSWIRMSFNVCPVSSCQIRQNSLLRKTQFRQWSKFSF